MKGITKIVFFGKLLADLNNLRELFAEFGRYFNADPGYEVDFCLYQLRVDPYVQSMTMPFPYQIYFPNTGFSFMQKRKVVHFFSNYIRQQLPTIIIAFDCFSVHLARKALTHSHISIPLLSWIPLSLAQLTDEYQSYLLDADCHFVASEQRKAQLIKKGVNEALCYVIYVPIRVHEEIIVRPSKVPLKLLYVGQIQYQDQQNLQHCFRILTTMKIPFRLDIVSGCADETAAQQLQKEAARLGVAKHIHWHEVTESPWDYIKEQIKTVSALILTSTYEGFDMAIGDGLARGIYCIGTDCEAGRHGIINQGNGLLYQPENSDELKQCLQKLAQNDTIPTPTAIKKSIAHLNTKPYFQRLNVIFSEIKSTQIIRNRK